MATTVSPSTAPDPRAHPDSGPDSRSAAARPTAAPGRPAEPAPPVAFSWRRHLPAVLLFWVLFGLLYANVIYLRMVDHGHDYWRLVVWQLVNWLAWAALTPLVVALGRRFPLEPRWRLAPRFALHAVLGLGVALLHLVPMAWATSLLNPYAPMTEPHTFTEVYRASLGSWFRLDAVIYWAILAGWTAWSAFLRAQDRERQAAELQALLSRRELELLRLQLQPHFLFNTLHTATSLIGEGASRDAATVLHRLSDLLRRVLDPRLGQEVALGLELDFLDRYLEIQRLRYPALRVEMEVEVAARVVPVPSLALQPLVENAIDHGVEDAAGERWVRLVAGRQGDRLVVAIENPADRAVDPRPGIGLANTRRRLREIHGDAARLELSQSDDGVMEVRLEVPWRTVVETAAETVAETAAGQWPDDDAPGSGTP